MTVSGLSVIPEQENRAKSSVQMKKKKKKPTKAKHTLGHVRNDLDDVVDEISGARVLPLFAVDVGRQLEHVRVRNDGFGSNDGADGGKVVVCFAEDPLTEVVGLRGVGNGQEMEELAT